MPSRSDAPEGADGETILEAVREHTHLLLGTTIGYSDEDWALPSRLPGWTRSHVAAHLVDNARGLLRVCLGLRTGRQVRMYESESARARSIEIGALADGLSLQISLDTSAGELHEELPGLLELDVPVQLRAGYQIPASRIPVARLYEVVLHTFDMTPECRELRISPDVAATLLQFKFDRLGRRADLPDLLVEADEGVTAQLGHARQPARVTGPAADLLLWLARDVVTPNVHGAPSLQRG